MFDFGPTAAQNDDRLADYFHPTRKVELLRDTSKPFPRFIFVARPGAGKSALFCWFETQAEAEPRLFLKGSKVRLITEASRANLADYRVIIEAELLTAVISEFATRKLGNDKTRKECEKYLRSGWFELFGDFLTTKLSGLSLFGFGFSLNSQERREYLRKIRETGRVPAAEEIVRGAVRSQPLTLLVDDPEEIVSEGLRYDTEENSLRLGAFLTVLNRLHTLGVRVIVFMRENVLQAVAKHFPDFSHFADRIDSLEWTEEDLESVLDLRLSRRLRLLWRDVFTVTKSAFREQVFPHLVNGPRDLIQVCNLAGHEEGKITAERLSRALRALRLQKWGEISTHYRGSWPRIDLFARAIIAPLWGAYGTGPISVNQFQVTFDNEFTSPDSPLHGLRGLEDWIDNAKWESPSPAERLFLIGCLGYWFGGKLFNPWTGRSLERFQLADAYSISALFAGEG